MRDKGDISPGGEVILRYSVPDKNLTARYSVAIAFLMLTSSRPVILASLATLGGAIWWALVRAARHQTNWWGGFVVAIATASFLFVAFAIGTYWREAKRPRLVPGQTLTASIGPEILTFNWPDGPERIRRSDVDKCRQALGFVLLAVSTRGVYMIVPKALVPPEVLSS